MRRVAYLAALEGTELDLCFDALEGEGDEGFDTARGRTRDERGEWLFLAFAFRGCGRHGEQVVEY